MPALTLELIAPFVSVAGVLLATASFIKLARSRTSSGLALQHVAEAVSKHMVQNTKQLKAIDDDLNAILAARDHDPDLSLKDLVPRFQAIAKDQTDVIYMLDKVKSKAPDRRDIEEIDRILAEMRHVKEQVDTVLQKAQSQSHAG